jgi:hypothetical protein
MANVVLRTDKELHASATHNITQLSWTAGRPEREGGSRLVVPELAVFVGAKRTQFLALADTQVTAGLRAAVAGVTCLASVRPQASLRLAAPFVLTGHRGFSPGRTRRSQRVEPAHSHSLEEAVDEGGIYSW